TILFAAHLSVGQQSQTQGKWIGTWKLNMSKSIFPPGAPERPLSVTHKMEAIPGGMRFTYENVDSRGVYWPRRLQYEALYGGMDVPVTGSAAYPGQSASVKFIDQYTYEVLITIPGLGTGFEHAVVSTDGRTLTRNVRQTLGGQVTNSVDLWDLEP